MVYERTEFGVQKAGICNDTSDFERNKFYIMFTSYVKKTLQETRKNYYIRLVKYLENVVSTDFLEFSNEGDAQTDDNLSKRNLTEDTMLFNNEEIEDRKLYDCLNNLTDKQKYILKCYYLENKNDVQISQSLNITRQAANKIRKRALENLKKNYGNGR